MLPFCYIWFMKFKVLIALAMLIAGWLSIGFGYTITNIGNLAGILLYGGILLFFTGVVRFILAVRSK